MMSDAFAPRLTSMIRFSCTSYLFLRHLDTHFGDTLTMYVAHNQRITSKTVFSSHSNNIFLHYNMPMEVATVFDTIIVNRALY